MGKIYSLEVELFGIAKWIGGGEKEVGRCKDVSQVSGTSMHVGFLPDTRPHKTVKALSFRTGQVGLIQIQSCRGSKGIQLSSGFAQYKKLRHKSSSQEQGPSLRP